MMVKFSIIISITDGGRDINDCLSSIINQTLVEFEVFCIDYKNNPQSTEILNSFAKNDKRINIISPQNNNTSELIKKLKGQYVLFLKGCEKFHNNAFKILYDEFENNNSDIILFNHIKYNAQNKAKKHVYLKTDDGILNKNNKKLAMMRSFEISSKAFKISFIKQNLSYPNYLFFNTILFNLQAFLITDNVSYISKFLFKTKQTSFKSIKDADKIEFFNICDDFEKTLKEKGLYKGNEDIFLQFKLYYSQALLKSLSVDFKEEFYQKMRSEFLKIDISNEIFDKISFRLYRFYIHVLNNELFGDFHRFNKLISVSVKTIDVNDLNEKIKNFDDVGIIKDSGRQNKLIVSLTSFPERIPDIHFCIYSLLNQKLKPDKVILWLAREEFPNGEDDLPKTLLDFKKNGLTISWCENIKSYKKLIPVLKQYPKDFIITVDDDVYYDSDWLEIMWDAYKKHPNTIISSRPRRIYFDSKNNIMPYDEWQLIEKPLNSSYLNFPTGAGGTMYFPNALSENVFDKSLFTKLCPTTDDIWFWAMAILNKRKITCTDKPYTLLTYINIARELKIIESHTLWQFNQEGNNDKQLMNVLNYFPEIYKILRG